MAIFAAMILASCSDDDKETTIDNLSAMICGQWLDQGSRGSWVMYDFQDNDVLEVTQWGDDQTYRGVYACVGGHVSAVYHVDRGFDWDVTEISSYYLRYKEGGNDAEHTLNRIVGELTMHPGESSVLNTSVLLPGASVTQCAVINSDIADFDQSANTITALAPGETFVTMLTEMGTVALRLVVANHIVVPD